MRESEKGRLNDYDARRRRCLISCAIGRGIAVDGAMWRRARRAGTGWAGGVARGCKGEAGLDRIRVVEGL